MKTGSYSLFQVLEAPTANWSSTEQCAMLRCPPKSWNDLRGSLAGPMHELDWFRACVEAFRLEPFVVAIGPPDRPRALAPLALVRGRLEAVGVRQLSEPMDFLAVDKDAATELAEAIAALGRPLLLPRIPTLSPVIPALRRIWRRAMWIERPMSSCPVLVLDQTWTDPESHLSSRRRADLRRARKRTARVEAEILIPTADETPTLVETALEIERRSWKGRNGTSVLQLPGRADFFRRYCQMKAADGTLRLAFLKIGGEYAAMQIAVERDNAYWLLKIGYDERFARCSPGQLLISHSIGWAAARGLSSYEFLGKAEDWISLWTQSQRPCVAIGVYPPRAASIRGALHDAWDVLAWESRQRRLAK